MSNPRGNPGNKGGGRRSAYQELADAKMLQDIFLRPRTKEGLRRKIIKYEKGVGKMSLLDILISKASQGDDPVLLAMFNRLFPATTKIQGDPKAPLLSPNTESPKLKELSDKFNEFLRSGDGRKNNQ